MVTTRGQAGSSKSNNMSKAFEALKKPSPSRSSKSIYKAISKPKSPVMERRRKISTAPRLGTHILFLFVGQQRELVTIHSDLLPESTNTYIAERNNGGQVYQLPDEDAAIFQIYRLFLYAGKFYSEYDDDQDVPDNGRYAVLNDSEWSRLAHCYFFGLAVRDERFANASIDAIIEKMTISDRYPTGIASEVYQHTTRGDNLRELLVDLHVWKGRGTWVKAPQDDANAPIEFLQDVISGLATAGADIHDDGAEMPWEEAPCAYYHMHEATAACRF